MATFPSQLPNESAKAYEAACAYFGMGADRSQEAVSKKLSKSRQIIGRWSAFYDWVERAKIYDQAMQQEVASEHTRRYLADLEDHRSRYASTGKELHEVALELLRAFQQSIKGKVIKGEDGKTYTIPKIELTPNTLAVITRAMTTAGDLEAHALGLDQIMPQLTGDDHDRGE